MEIDIAKQIGAVTRRVSAREHEGKPARAILAERVYSTTVDDLWEAVTSAERLPRWFSPVSGELKLGGRFQIENNAAGTVVACQPPRHFNVTWEFGGKTSWVDVRIDPAPGGARLTLEHLAHEDEHWTKFGPGAGGLGWDLGLTGLDRHITTGGAMIFDEGMEWMLSDEGKSFMSQSADAWRLADIAGGEKPEVAKAAADRTIAAYTGGA